jgi:hypothetical protein
MFHQAVLHRVTFCGVTAMVEPWDAMVKAAMAGTHKAQDGLLDGCDAHTGSETTVGTLQAR